MHGYCRCHEHHHTGWTNISGKVLKIKTLKILNFHCKNIHFRRIELNKFRSYRVIGALIIAVGLYLVVWGKSKDHKDKTTNDPEANNLENLGDEVT